MAKCTTCGKDRGKSMDEERIYMAVVDKEENTDALFALWCSECGPNVTDDQGNMPRLITPKEAQESEQPFITLHAPQ